jgi:hypothetical protein
MIYTELYSTIDEYNDTLILNTPCNILKRMQPTQPPTIPEETTPSKVYRARSLKDGTVLRLPEGVKPGTLFVVRVNPTTGIVTAVPMEVRPKEVIDI